MKHEQHFDLEAILVAAEQPQQDGGEGEDAEVHKAAGHGHVHDVGEHARNPRYRASNQTRRAGNDEDAVHEYGFA